MSKRAGHARGPECKTHSGPRQVTADAAFNESSQLGVTSRASVAGSRRSRSLPAAVTAVTTLEGTRVDDPKNDPRCIAEHHSQEVIRVYPYISGENKVNPWSSNLLRPGENQIETKIAAKLYQDDDCIASRSYLLCRWFSSWAMVLNMTFLQAHHLLISGWHALCDSQSMPASIISVELF